MTDQPAPIRRRLTDDERQLLANLAVWCIAEQKGVTDDEARNALAALNERRGLYMSGDDTDAYVRFKSGKVIIHATREWLAYWAHSEEPLTSEELRRTLKWGDIP